MEEHISFFARMCGKGFCIMYVESMNGHKDIVNTRLWTMKKITAVENTCLRILRLWLLYAK